MKKLVMAVAMLGALASNAYASDLTTSGDVSAYGGIFNINDKYSIADDGSGGAFGAAVRVNTWYTPTVSAQYDLTGDFTRINSKNDRYSSNATDFAIHLNHRYDDFLMGALVSYGHAGGDNYWDGSKFMTMAGEAQLISGKQVFYFQAGFAKGLSSTADSAPYIRAEVRHFFTPNTVLSGNFGYSNLAYDHGGSSIQHKNYGVDLEHRLNDSQFSVFGSYRGSYNNEFHETETWSTNALVVGVKMSFGGNSTLQAASKSGPTLADYNPFTGVDRLRFGDWE